MQKYRLNNEHSGTFFCNSSLIEDDEDARPVVMGEDDYEWQCAKLIHRQQWKDVVQSELDDFRLFMKYAYGSDVEEEHFNQKGGKFDDDLCDKDKEIPATLRNSILRRKVQKDIDAGSERQSDWDVMPELLERKGCEAGWKRKEGDEIIFDKDLLINDEFRDQWEIIWQDWQTNPLTKHAIEEKEKFCKERRQRNSEKNNLRIRDDDDFGHDEEHLEECGLLNWTCKHAQCGEKRWEKERKGMIISSILSSQRRRNWYDETNRVLPPNNLTAGNKMYFVKEEQKEKVEAINAKLIRTQVKGEKMINGAEAATFGRRKGVRWTTYKEANEYHRDARKRMLFDEGFVCKDPECVKVAKIDDERDGFFKGHSESCKERLVNEIMANKGGKVAVRGSHETFREQYRDDMERLIQAKNIWGTLWAFELNRLQTEDVRAYAYQNAILSCNWDEDKQTDRGNLIMQANLEAASCPLRQRFVDRVLKRMEGEMDIGVEIVNEELLRRSGGSKENLRLRRMPLHSFQSLIRSSESMNDRYLWEEQLVKVYDVKHSWLKQKLSKELQDMIDADCPPFVEGGNNTYRDHNTPPCHFCQPGMFSRDSDGEYLDNGRICDCDFSKCYLCQREPARMLRNAWRDDKEEENQLVNEVHPTRRHLLKTYSANDAFGVFSNKDAVCRHERFIRCGCYRDYEYNPRMGTWQINNKDKPMVSIHYYNCGRSMNFQRYSSTVGLGNAPVMFSGELYRPYAIDASLEVGMIKEKLAGGDGGEFPNIFAIGGGATWFRWREVYPEEVNAFDDDDDDWIREWNPIVDWEAVGPRLRGLDLHWLRGTDDIYLPSE